MQIKQMCKLVLIVFISIFYTTQANRIFQAFNAADTPDGDGSNWFEARNFCEMQVNGRLADPRDSDENQAILDICPNDRCWIGLISDWAPVDHLIISEFLPNPSGNDDENEFIELFNPTTATINLGTFSIKDDGADNDALPAVDVAPGNYFLWCRSDAYTLCDATTYPGWLGNDGDEVVLMQGTTEIDRINYAEASVIEARSLFRRSSFENTPGFDFAMSDTDAFTPGTGNLETANIGSTSDDRWEWISTGEPVVYQNWFIDGSNPTQNDGNARGFIYGMSSSNLGEWADTVFDTSVDPTDDLIFICVTDTSAPTTNPTLYPTINPTHDSDDDDDDDDVLFMAKSDDVTIGNMDVYGNTLKRNVTLVFDENTIMTVLAALIVFVLANCLLCWWCKGKQTKIKGKTHRLQSLDAINFE